MHRCRSSCPQSITSHYADSAQVLAELRAVRVDYDDVVEQLERQGVTEFVGAWNHLLEHLEQSMSDYYLRSAP